MTNRRQRIWSAAPVVLAGLALAPAGSVMAEAPDHGRPAPLTAVLATTSTSGAAATASLVGSPGWEMALTTVGAGCLALALVMACGLTSPEIPEARRERAR